MVAEVLLESPPQVVSVNLVSRGTQKEKNDSTSQKQVNWVNLIDQLIRKQTYEREEKRMRKLMKTEERQKNDKKC